MTTTIQELEDLGMTAAAAVVREDRELAGKARNVFEHYLTVVKPEHIRKFQEKLKATTVRVIGQNSYGMITSHDTLVIRSLATYTKVPPPEALAKIREAKDIGCFDEFEIATVESVRTIPDPIVFGVIRGCEDRYFITQWDKDVSVEQILAKD